MQTSRILLTAAVSLAVTPSILRAQLKDTTKAGPAKTEAAKPAPAAEAGLGLKTRQSTVYGLLVMRSGKANSRDRRRR